MKNENLLLHEYAELLKQSAKYCLESGVNLTNIWKLSKRGILFEIFKKYDKSGVDHIAEFREVVRAILEKKNKNPSDTFLNKCFFGRLLLFSPRETMYDSLIEGLTDGFFDSDDCPPPEFWIKMEGDRLISFIPDEYLGIATIGVENCMSSCLDWGSDRIQVNIEVKK